MKLTLFCIGLSSCSIGPSVSELVDYVPPDLFELVVKTDFEPDSTSGSPVDAHTVITLRNLASPTQSNLPLPEFLQMMVNYEGGTTADRFAKLVPDPTDSTNQVLHYWLRNATIPTGFQSHTKGRIQIAIDPANAQVGLPRVYAKVRVYLHPDLGILTEYSTSDDPWWIGVTLQEFWFGADFDEHPAHARISLGIGPDLEDGVLRLSAACETTENYEEFWSVSNPDFVMLTGEWLTIETGYVMGNATEGRFKVVVSSASLPAPVTVLDVHDTTYNPHADELGIGPVALSHWHPMKFYMSDNTAHFIRDRDGVAQLYLDDFEFAETWPAGWE